MADWIWLVCFRFFLPPRMFCTRTHHLSAASQSIWAPSTYVYTWINRAMHCGGNVGGYRIGGAAKKFWRNPHGEPNQPALPARRVVWISKLFSLLYTIGSQFPREHTAAAVSADQLTGNIIYTSGIREREKLYRRFLLLWCGAGVYKLMTRTTQHWQQRERHGQRKELAFVAYTRNWSISFSFRAAVVLHL